METSTEIIEIVHKRIYETYWKGRMMSKGTPKKDGSGQGRRANRGRGGCKTTKKSGSGMNK